MALPFIKRIQRQPGGVITEMRSPDGLKEQNEGPEDKEDLKACAEDIMRAIKNSDVTALAEALKAAHEICDSYEHEEGPHTNEPETKDEE